LTPTYAQCTLATPVGFPQTQTAGTVMTVDIAVSGNPVTITAAGDVHGCDGPGNGCIFLRRCGTPDVDFAAQWVEATQFTDQNFALAFVDEPPAGTHTYALMFTAGSAAECGMCFGSGGACGPVLSAFELGGGGQVNAIACTTLTATGDILVASAASTPTALPIGNPGEVLTVASSGTTLEYANWGTWQSEAFTIGATTTAPTLSTPSWSCLWYRQTGPNTWEVCGNYCKTSSTNFDGGSGDYLICLPNGLSFCTANGYGQIIYTGNDSTLWQTNSVPGRVLFSFCNSADSAGWVSAFACKNNTNIIPYSATQFRLTAGLAGNSNIATTAWSSSHMSVGNTNYPRLSVNFEFSFRSA